MDSDGILGYSDNLNNNTMKTFLTATFLLAIGIQLTSMWIILISEKIYNIEYKFWMLIILYIGCACMVGSVMELLDKYKKQ